MIISRSIHEDSLFSTPFLAFIICRLFNDGHSDQSEVIPYCSFDLHFSNSYCYWASFHVPSGHLYVFFGKMSIQILFPFFFFWLGYLFFLILICMSCLYILEVNPLSVTWFSNIFSHSVGCLFVLLMVSFAGEKTVSSISSAGKTGQPHVE